MCIRDRLEVARLDLKAHTAAGPLLGLADGLAEHLLTAGVAAVGADIQRQIDAHVGEVGQDGEPGLARHVADAGHEHLVLTWDALEGARAGDIRGLMRGGGAGNGVVDLLGLQTRAHERLGGASGDAQAALAAAVQNVDRAVLDLDRVHRAYAVSYTHLRQARNWRQDGARVRRTPPSRTWCTRARTARRTGFP